MTRSERRFRDRVAELHRVRIVTNFHGWRWYVKDPWAKYGWVRATPWARRRRRDVSDLAMNEPCGEWNRCMHLRPARIRSHQLCRLVKLGRDPDQLTFPITHRPLIYYW